MGSAPSHLVKRFAIRARASDEGAVRSLAMNVAGRALLVRIRAWLLNERGEIEAVRIAFGIR